MQTKMNTLNWLMTSFIARRESFLLIYMVTIWKDVEQHITVFISPDSVCRQKGRQFEHN